MDQEARRARARQYYQKYIATHPEYLKRHNEYVKQWKRENPDHYLHYAQATVEKYEALHGVPPADSPFFKANRSTRYPDKDSRSYWRAKRYLIAHQKEGEL